MGRMLPELPLLWLRLSSDVRWFLLTQPVLLLLGDQQAVLADQQINMVGFEKPEAKLPECFDLLQVIGCVANPIPVALP